MQFPKHVYKHGTGKKVNESGLHTAEYVRVNSPEELEALGPGWAESPVGAVSSGAAQKSLAELSPAKADGAAPEAKPAKKVK